MIYDDEPPPKPRYRLFYNHGSWDCYRVTMFSYLEGNELIYYAGSIEAL